jgi:hypothetical protein
MQTLFCRHPNCGKPFESAAGDQPDVCPACRQGGLWSTSPGDGWDATKPVCVAPQVKFELSFNDRRFLKSLRIDPEGRSGPGMTEDRE